MVDSGLIESDDGICRCFWYGGKDDYLEYHDHEWGRPVTDDRRLFEKICLEGFQSGLSWLTILRKRENFRAGFANFDFDAVAHFNKDDVERLVQDAGIIHHRGKIESTINNARRACEMRDEFGSLAAYFWAFEPAPDQRPSRLDHAILMTMGKTETSTAISKDLKKARLELRRPDHRLCLHAGNGDGQRPYRGMLRACGMRGRARRACPASEIRLMPRLAALRSMV